MMLPITTDWLEVLAAEWKKEYMKQLGVFLTAEYQTQQIYPSPEKIFEAFQWTPYQDVKVVILGQDPYHGPNQAHGLSFSVLPGSKVPPSLRNIYQELANDLGYPPVSHGYLEKWAKQGVLLLNTVLTVREGHAHSHKNQGWEQLTDKVIEHLNQHEKPLVFILWGKPAQLKAQMIDNERHFILMAPHPSPLSAYRGFFGTQPFSKTNQLLTSIGERPIDWQLPETV